jgi:hypothetical protein
LLRGLLLLASSRGFLLRSLVDSEFLDSTRRGMEALRVRLPPLGRRTGGSSSSHRYRLTASSVSGISPSRRIACRHGST